MRIAVVNPNASEAVGDRIIEAAQEVAGRPSCIMSFTAPYGPTAIDSYAGKVYAAAETVGIVVAAADVP